MTRYHLILLHWEMPEMDGITTLRHVKKNEKTAQIPVIIYTGIMTDSVYLAQALEEGAADFLRKPTESIELIARVRSILTQKRESERRIALERENAAIQQEMLQRRNILLQQELQNQLLALAQKNELLTHIKDECQKSITNNSVKKIQDVTQQIDKLLEQEDYWSTFLDKFSQIDRDFIKRLTAQHPDFSPTEIRLCGLIRCSLDSKSIAHLLNISLASVNTCRYRIRKKINMENEDNLEKYLFSI